MPFDGTFSNMRSFLIDLWSTIAVRVPLANTKGRAIEILGAITGVAASFAISEVDQRVALAGWFGFGVSNVCLLYCHMKGRMPYLFLMQLAFLASSLKGVLAILR